MMPLTSFRRLVHTAILSGLAAYFYWLIATGNLANYVNIRIEWMTFMAAILLTVYAVQSLLQEPENACGCGHTHGSWKALAMIVPLFLGFCIPSKPLGAGAIGDTDIQMMMRQHVDMSMLATPERVDDAAMLYNPLNDLYPEQQFSTDNPLHFTILDWLRLYADTDRQNAFAGQKADVTGFVVKDPSQPDGFIVTRFFMRHCIFDTIPIGIAVRWNDARDLDEDMWVRVQGTFTLKTVDGSIVPVLNATNVKQVRQPETPYLYPQMQ